MLLNLALLPNAYRIYNATHATYSRIENTRIMIGENGAYRVARRLSDKALPRRPVAATREAPYSSSSNSNLISFGVHPSKTLAAQCAFNATNDNSDLLSNDSRVVPRDDFTCCNAVLTIGSQTRLCWAIVSSASPCTTRHLWDAYIPDGGENVLFLPCGDCCV